VKRRLWAIPCDPAHWASVSGVPLYFPVAGGNDCAFLFIFKGTNQHAGLVWHFAGAGGNSAPFLPTTGKWPRAGLHVDCAGVVGVPGVGDSGLRNEICQSNHESGKHFLLHDALIYQVIPHPITLAGMVFAVIAAVLLAIEEEEPALDNALLPEVGE